MPDIELQGNIAGVSTTVSELTVTWAVYSNSSAKEWHDLIQELGIDAVITSNPLSVFNSDTNSVILGETRSHSIKVIPPYKNREGWKANDIRGSHTELISSGKGLTGIANYQLNFVVKPGLKITIDSKEWTVIGYTEVKDRTGILVYILEIEAGN